MLNIKTEKMNNEFSRSWMLERNVERLIKETATPMLKEMHDNLVEDIQTWKDQDIDDLTVLLEFYKQSLYSSREMWIEIVGSYFESRNNLNEGADERISSEMLLKEILREYL